jgi:hypothetical protein
MKIFLIDYSIAQDIEDYFARSFDYYCNRCTEDFLNSAEYSTIRLVI